MQSNELINIDGITINTTVTLSTSNQNESFWGTTFSLPTGKINNEGKYIIFITSDQFFDNFKEHLIDISQPFPILLEKIKYLKVHCHEKWEESIIKQYLDPSQQIYFCDHQHQH